MTINAAWPLSVVGAEEAAVRAVEDMGGTRKGDRHRWVSRCIAAER